MRAYSFSQYIDLKKNIVNSILKYLDSQENCEDNYRSVIDLVTKSKITEDSEEFILFLQTLSKISCNHHYTFQFYDKIIKILQYFKNDIIQKLPNATIFDTFYNKRILLYLIEDGILKLDEEIYQKMVKMNANRPQFIDYFYPEIESFLTEEEKAKIKETLPDNFDRDRKVDILQDEEIEGETEINILGHKIRKDLIDEFIPIFEKQNFDVCSTFNFNCLNNKTIFEKNEVTIIEYAAYFGSEKVVNYLLDKKYKVRKDSKFRYLWFEFRNF
ncbi:hypothetical protein M9Y10_019141 [Tritrichomonas musculus]|uniref:Ankyrin repeat protein n=1 Tax=Tritrichomonas musculus TaxID=1915356 RepID=A0ABR2HJL6_9EUKA